VDLERLGREIESAVPLWVGTQAGAVSICPVLFSYPGFFILADRFAGSMVWMSEG